ncbi:MAG: hypothetical protein L3J21_11690 [Devosiaceae bacterium]|nr:hypothetical protein [Devosiaceae bacterium]
MNKKLTAVLALVFSGLVLNFPAKAQEVSFDPNAPCSQVLQENSSAAALWAFGYLANKIQRARSVDDKMVVSFLDDYEPACNSSPDESFVAVLDQLLGGIPAASNSSQTQEQTGETELAPQLLAALRAPDADLAQILLSLKPQPEDIRAVFPESMVANLIEMYEGLFGERLAGENFPPPPYDVSATFTTTEQLVNDALLDELPGGFKRVLDKFQINAPFGLVKVGFPSVDDSLPLSGLIFVNDRWVLMMRPWRGLQE